MHDFSDKVVLITGAAGNLGGVAAHAFGRASAHLALLDIHAERLQKVCGELGESPDHLLIGSVDMTEAESVAAAVTQVIDRFGRIDILINTAGGYRAGEPVEETSIETWDFMMNLNARSAFLGARSIVPHMLSQGTGAIVNIGARPGIRGVANAAAYGAAKSAVIRLTESLAAELKQKGIRVNCVLPGTMDTPQNRAAMPEAKHELWVAPNQVVEVILFLASPSASAVHGAAIPVYGLS